MTREKDSICVPEIIGRAKRQFLEESRMEEMDRKHAVIRHGVFVVHDLLLEKCRGKKRPSKRPCWQISYFIVIECSVDQIGRETMK